MTFRFFSLLMTLASVLALSTETALAVHLYVEGPAHEFDDEECPICNQLSAGAAAPVDDPGPIICCPETTFLYFHWPVALEFRADALDFGAPPRAPPIS